MVDLVRKYIQTLMYQYYQVKVLCNPEQQISDMNHHREQQQQQQQQQQRDEQHENVHEKNQVRRLKSIRLKQKPGDRRDELHTNCTS